MLESSSIYATKVGTRFPDQMYIVSAHLDGRGGGGAANDDASGCSLVLEAARALAGLPTNAFSANGAGSNTITVSPDHDLVVVWRWHQGSAGEFARRVVAAIKPGTM